MKRIILALLILLASLAQAQAKALTSEASLNMVGGVSAGYYYLYPKDTQVKDYYRGSWLWKGFLELKSESGLSVGGEISYYSEANRSTTAPNGTTLTIIPVIAQLSYHFLKDRSISPYLGGGIGLYNINESDPDYNYLSATKFGKHIFAGLDIHLTADTILRAELRETFIDPVNSALYYQANLGGITASLGLALEWPVFRPQTPLTPEEKALAAEQRLYETKLQEQTSRLREMEYYYQQQQWDAAMYRRWKSRDALLYDINQTKAQIEQEKAKTEQLKLEQEQKRQQYLEQKAKLRQEKKDASNKWENSGKVRASAASTYGEGTVLVSP